MSCTHRTPDCWIWVEVETDPFYGTTEDQLVNTGGKSTQVDIDVGRFRCTQCGEVGYYTGLWKRYFEEGVPCSGSDGVPRSLPK